MPSAERPRLRENAEADPTEEVTRIAGNSPAANVPSGGYERGHQVGRYIVIEELGAGGMSVVYLAYDPELDRKVAIKVLRSTLSSQEASEATTMSQGSRLVREAQALARLSHPNVLPVFDVGTIGDQLFLTAEYVEGWTLADWLKAEPRTWREVVTAFLDAGKGLAAAHRVGLIHRDFKPQNVLVGKDGAVRVMDFGLVCLGHEDPVRQALPSTGNGADAKCGLTARTQGITGDGITLGTPAYMPPEQHLATGIDARADQYAFCVALYQGLYGVTPFARGSQRQLLERKQGLELQPIPADAPHVPSWLRRIIIRGLEPQPARRWPSMDVLLARLANDPRKRMFRGLSATLVLGLALGGSWAYGQAQAREEAICSGGPSRLEGIWDPSVQATMKQAFLATDMEQAHGAWAQTRRQLVQYADQWLKDHRDACESTHVKKEQSEEILDLRMACLDGRLRVLDAATQLFAEADAQVVENASNIVNALPALEDCRTVDGLRGGPPPPTKTQEGETNVLRDRIAQVHILEAAGKYREAVPLAEKTLARARALGYSPVTTEALFGVAALAYRNGQFERATELAQQVAWQARANHQDDLASTSMVMLVGAYGTGLGDSKKAVAWGRHAEAASRRIGSLQDQADLNLLLGSLYTSRKQYEEALRHSEQALKLAMQAEQPEGPKVASANNTLGILLTALGQTDRALECLQKAKTLLEQHFEAGHPHVGVVLENIGQAQAAAGGYKTARSSLEEARSILEASVGPDHIIVGNLLQTYADVLLKLRDVESAVSSYRRSFEISSPIAKPERLAELQFLLSRALVEADRLEEAAAALEEGRAFVRGSNERNPELAGELAVTEGSLLAAQDRHRHAVHAFEEATREFRKAPGHHQNEIAHSLLHQAKSLNALGIQTEAADTLRDAIEASETLPPHPRAALRFEVAKALFDSGDRDLAIEIAEGVRENYRTARQFADPHRADVEGWLAQHADDVR